MHSKKAIAEADADPAKNQLTPHVNEYLNEGTRRRVNKTLAPIRSTRPCTSSTSASSCGTPALNQVVRGQNSERCARGIFEHYAYNLNDATDSLKLWNQRNPTNLIRITPTVIHERIRNKSLTQDIGTIKALKGDAVATLH